MALAFKWDFFSEEKEKKKTYDFDKTKINGAVQRYLIIRTMTHVFIWDTFAEL